MNKRLLDKKVVKIEFNESSDEQEYYYNWDVLNISSDDENFFNGKSEVLWSRTGNLFEYSDSPQGFSDLTGRTLSSCSWHNDEFDMKSTSKVNASLEAIDDALYENIKSPFMSETVFQECCDWSEKFPYLRIKGEQIFQPYEDGFTLNSSNAVCIQEYKLRTSCTSLQLEGRKLPLHSASRSKEVYFDCGNDNKATNCLKEAIGEEPGEYFALHKSDGPGDTFHTPATENAKSISSIKVLQEKVLDKLVSEMWPSVLALLEKLDDKNYASDELQLPPIIVASEQKRAFHLQRPRTEGSSFINTEFPKLDNILTVSPKVLQKREFGNSRIARPNSEMSVNLRASSKALKPVSYQANPGSIHSKSDSLFSKGIKNERESENMCFVLPALEEDFQDTSSMLRGFHIEPGRKETVTQKTILSSRNEYESISTSRENEYFLPPIEDKSYVPTNIKLTKNLFTFYGPPVIPDKTNKTCGSARYKKTNSRPSTSVSKKAKKHDVSQQLSVKNGLFITARNICKTPVSPHTERNTQDLLSENETAVETSQEKSVTLFPIVTPLTPHEDRNHSSRKGLLHTFLGGKKR